MIVTSTALNNIAAELRTMGTSINDFGGAWSTGVGTFDGAISNVRASWGGPRPDQDLAAAVAYIDDVRALEDDLAALASSINRFADAAEGFAGALATLESQPWDDPDAEAQALRRRESIAVDWLDACYRHSWLIGDAYAPVYTKSIALATGFSQPVRQSTSYYGFVAAFALEEDLDLMELDPTGTLSDAVSTAERELIDHPLAWLLLSAIETANSDQSITDADGNVTGDDRDDALDPGRIAELIREANALYGLELSEEEIAQMATLAVGATALVSASDDPSRLEGATESAYRGARPTSPEQLQEVLTNNVPDFLEKAPGIFDEQKVTVSVVHLESERVFVFSDGTSTAVYAEHVSDSVLVIEAVPTNLTSFARGLEKSAGLAGGAFDVIDIGNATMDGWAASEGQPLPERALRMVTAGAPAAAEVGVDLAAAEVGATVCSPGGPLLAGACAFSAPIFVDFVASLDNPGAPPSFCVDGEFDAEQADAMNFDHTSEEVVGCPPVPSTVPE